MTDSSLSRRGFLGAVLSGAAAAKLPLSERLPPKSQPEAAKSTSHALCDETLAGYRFIDQDGKEVSLAALKTALKEKFATLTFGFEECTLLCPNISKRLAAIDAFSPGNIMHVVIGVDPERDGKDQNSRNAYLKKFTDNGIKASSMRVLFAIKGGDEKNPVFDKEAAVNIEIKTGAIVDAGDPLSHTANIVLYGKDGKQVGKKSALGKAADFDEWKNLMQPPKEVEKVRGR